MTMACLTMSTSELNRSELMRRVHERRLTQRKAAEQLGLSERQVQRLYRAYLRDGPTGLVSKKRGRPSNRRLDERLRQRALELVAARYTDFGPTLAQEKLSELHALSVSVETLRKWMVSAGLWTPRSKRQRRVQQPRRRRECLGELVQIDGCDHEWFEQRGPRCVLLVFVDDASSRLMELRFCASESTFEYFTSTRRYLQRHGKPVAFYSDKAGIFRVNAKQPKGGDGYTQFGRAMSELNIDVICANTPAAKGRVERAHLTLQDRLVKELRLRGICTIEQGNEFLPEFMRDYDRRFAREPRNAHDAHRPLLAHESLDAILLRKELRQLSNNLTVNYKRTLYLLEATEQALSLRGKRVMVHESEDGRVRIHHEGVELSAQPFPREDARLRQGAIVDNKLLGAVFEHIRDNQQQREHRRSRGRLTLRERALLQRHLPDAAE